MRVCVTTNEIVTDDFVEFHCPSCNERIVRSLRARQKAMPYKCPACDFDGP